MAKRGKYSRNISNLRRAINKLGGYTTEPHFGQVAITNIKTSPLYVEWTENGVQKKAEYKNISTVAQDPKELRLRLQVDLAANQEREALYQLKTKGRISTQFKIATQSNYKTLKSEIQSFEESIGDITKTEMMELFAEDSILTEDDIFFEDSDIKNRFYHEFGFDYMNEFTVRLFEAKLVQEGVMT